MSISKLSNVELGIIQQNTGVALGYRINSLIDSVELVTNKEVTSPYTVTSKDSGIILIFDEASGALNIPDGLADGSMITAVNIGAGSVVVSLVTDTVRGDLTLQDIDGILSLTKLTATLWQSSERL